MEYDYWLFYLNDDDSLYAYTDDKKLAKRFKHERNMKLFTCKKVKLDKEGVKYLAEDVNDGILHLATLHTKDADGKTYDIKLVISKMEEYTVMVEGGDLVASKLMVYAWTPLEIFSPKLRKSLKVLGYKDCSDQITFGYESDIFTPDDLGIFLKHYGDTLDGGE